MKTYKCVKAWQRHGVGTTINEWEYTKLPINIKSGHFQEITSTDVAPLPSTTNTPIWTEGSKPIDLNVQLTDAAKATFPIIDHHASSEVNVNSVGANFGNTPLTTFSSGNKFKDKIRPSKNEDDIRPTE